MRLVLLALLVSCSREPPPDPLDVVSGDVRAGRYFAAAHRIAASPLPDRPGLAFRAAADAPSPDALAAAAVEAELATAAADRLERDARPRAALAARRRAAALGPARAEHHDALARAQLDADQLDAALASWDRAAALAPAQPSYKLAPIRALVAAGDPRARTRARALPTSDVETLLVASSAAAITADHARAIELARQALARRPNDGRLIFTLGERLAATGDPSRLIELLICGAHGRAWHRHEIAARLVTLDSATVLGALAAPPTCTPIDPTDLAGYVGAVRAKLAEPH